MEKCVVKWMELRASYHPSSAQIMGTSVSSLGWLRVGGVGEEKMERGKRAKTVENVEIS